MQTLKLSGVRRICDQIGHYPDMNEPVGTHKGDRALADCSPV